MKTCIATAQKADGSHVCLYVGPDGAKALEACINPPAGCVQTAAFIRPQPSKKRKFENVAAEPADSSETPDNAPGSPEADPKAPKPSKAKAPKPSKAKES